MVNDDEKGCCVLCVAEKGAPGDIFSLKIQDGKNHVAGVLDVPSTVNKHITINQRSGHTPR